MPLASGISERHCSTNGETPVRDLYTLVARALPHHELIKLWADEVGYFAYNDAGAEWAAWAIWEEPGVVWC